MSKKKDVDRIKSAFGKLKDDNFNFELIEKYFRNKDGSDSYQILSDKTCNDLDFSELFMFIDRTNSKIGQQYLYYRLRHIPLNNNSRDLNEDIIQNLTRDSDFRINTQVQLKKLETDDAFYISSLFQEEHLKPPKWFFIIRLLSFTSLLSIILLPYNPRLIFLLLGILITNVGIHYWNILLMR